MIGDVFIKKNPKAEGEFGVVILSEPTVPDFFTNYVRGAIIDENYEPKRIIEIALGRNTEFLYDNYGFKKAEITEKEKEKLFRKITLMAI